MRARRVLPVLLVLATVAVGASGCFSSKLANTTISGEVTIGEGSTAQVVNPGTAAGSATTTSTASTGEASTAQGSTGSTATTTGGSSGADLAAGKTAFTATCGGCHTLKDAGTNGKVGPDLDSLAPLTVERVAQQIMNGGGPMPPGLLTGRRRRERRRVRGVGRRQVERSVPATVLELPPGLDARSRARGRHGSRRHRARRDLPALAAHRRRDRARRGSGIACLIATGRMFISARRVAEQLGIRRPLVCYQGALVADPVSGEILVHRPIEAALAKEILRAMPEQHARRSNLYIDDQLYVWEENEATLRYSQVAGVQMHVVGPLADWLERPTTKIVTVGQPAARWTRCATCCSRSSGAARSWRSRCRTSSSSPRPASRRPAGSRSSPTCSASRPPQAIAVGRCRERPRDARLGRLRLAVANADERLRARRTA